jgi:hypothetical protein
MRLCIIVRSIGEIQEYVELPEFMAHEAAYGVEAHPKSGLQFVDGLLPISWSEH